jgi:hypothetical protein
VRKRYRTTLLREDTDICGGVRVDVDGIRFGDGKLSGMRGEGEMKVVMELGGVGSGTCREMD